MRTAHSTWGIAVVFMVQNLERTRRFYADALGLELAEKEGYLTGILASGTELVFFEGEAVRGTSPQIVFTDTTEPGQ